MPSLDTLTKTVMCRITATRKPTITTTAVEPWKQSVSFSEQNISTEMFAGLLSLCTSDGTWLYVVTDFGNAHWHGNTGLVTDPENEGPWAGADLEQGMY